MATNLRGMLAALESHQAASGAFDRIARHEPKAAPGPGVTAATWLNSGRPQPGASGMASTSGRLELVTRFYKPMLTGPEDEIDPLIYDAVDALMTAYSADFTLGGIVRQIDLLGLPGSEPLSWRAGYITHARTPYRAVDMVTPLIVNDMYPQVP